MAQNGSSQKRDRQGLAYQNRLPHGQAAQYETLRVSLGVGGVPHDIEA